MCWGTRRNRHVSVISMHLSVFFLLPYKKLGAWGSKSVPTTD